MKFYTRIVVLVSVVLAVAISILKLGALSHERIAYVGGDPPTGFLAQTDYFWWPSQNDYYGWTMARYSRSGYPLNLHRQSEGLREFGGTYVTQYEDAYSSFLIAEGYWADSTYETGTSWVKTTSGSEKEAWAQVTDTYP